MRLMEKQVAIRMTDGFKKMLEKGSKQLKLTQTEVIQRGVLMYFNEMLVERERNK